jgi:hypothetical protein
MEAKCGLDDYLKKGILFGALAGIIGGIAVLSVIMTGVWNPIYTEAEFVELFGPPKIWTTEMLIYLWIAVLAHDTFWGVIFGLFYTRTFDVIPGKGILKGLVFSMAIYLVSNVRMSELMSNLGNTAWPKWGITNGFVFFIAYGLAIGYLYKKK